jgi:hypothetical protein
MSLSRKHASALALAALVFAWPKASKAEVELGKAAGWTVSTDGRVNAFVSHAWGEDRPEGLGSLPWVGFNEAGSRGEVNSDLKLRKTRIRSGYVPSTLAFNFRKHVSDEFKLSSREHRGVGNRGPDLDGSALRLPRRGG